MSLGRRGERQPRKPFSGHTGRHVPIPGTPAPPEDPAPDPGPAPCSCPQKAGMIRHLRQTCTDPVVARLDWYAAESEPWAGACEAYGPEGQDAGAVCFLSAQAGKRVCGSQGECAAAMAAERRRVFRRISELAAGGDETAAYLAQQFSSPEQLLNPGYVDDYCADDVDLDGEQEGR